MCSNFQAITRQYAEWLQQHFQLELPLEGWREEIYPTYIAPFICLENGKARCDLAEFGLVPAWAASKPKFGLKTYNAGTETVADKPSYRNAWKRKQYGIELMQGFYEPNYETGEAIRWRIKRADGYGVAVHAVFSPYA